MDGKWLHTGWMNNMLQTDLSKIKYYGGKNEWIRVETYRRS